MKQTFNYKNFLTKPALIGAALTVICGLILWGTSLGAAWENTSYDLLFNFGSHSVTNQMVLVEMVAGAERNLIQERQQHTELLKKLTSDGARLVVFDVLFQQLIDSETDKNLAAAMAQNGKVVLMADIADTAMNQQLDSARIDRPNDLFFHAAAGCGLGHADSPTGEITRRHWPFLNPSEGNFHSLGWVAANFFGATLDDKMEQQWLRYYGKNGPGERVTYARALAKSSGYFRNKIVFIGSWPEKPNDPSFRELSNDKFSTPYTRWTGQAIGGVEIMQTTFLNLVQGDWLRRLSAPWEFLLIVLTGFLIGGGLRQLKPLPALLVAIGIFLLLVCGFVTWSYFSNFWFPWLVIAGGQLPLALAWAWASWTQHVLVFSERFPGYTPLGAAFGAGAYGKVWLVRNATGQLQALKEIELAKFQDGDPYEREFRGIKSYKPISNQHTGLLHIDHVNRNEPDGYFYYVMELGDARDSSWEQKGLPYQPLDLPSACQLQENRRLAVRECLRIGLTLLDALDYLHQLGLVHRDIKPANVIFVSGRAKLADVGLVRETSVGATWVGTDYFMPPAPETPGTKTADIYALGKLLYVISTGNSVRMFPELPEALVENPEFMRLNAVVCRACQPAANQRYASVAEMLTALREIQTEFDASTTIRI